MEIYLIGKWTIINIYPMRRYRIWRFIQSSHVISDEALAELDIILARLNKSPYPILPNRINILSFTIIKKRKRKFIFFKATPLALHLRIYSSCQIISLSFCFRLTKIEIKFGLTVVIETWKTCMILLISKSQLH